MARPGMPSAGGWRRSPGLREPGGDLLFRVLRRSTIGAEGFHGRVRDGIGCFAPRYGHQAFQKAVISNQNRSLILPDSEASCACLLSGVCRLLSDIRFPSSDIWNMVLAAGRGAPVHRAISTGQLRGLPRFHLRPIDVVVYHGSRRDLVLRRVSRLDAFSGYPVRT